MGRLWMRKSHPESQHRQSTGRQPLTSPGSHVQSRADLPSWEPDRMDKSLPGPHWTPAL